MRFGSSKGERAGAWVGVLAGLVILVVCLDLALDGALLGWLGVPASSTLPEGGGCVDCGD
jgi:hypothetical protein